MVFGLWLWALEKQIIDWKVNLKHSGKNRKLKAENQINYDSMLQ
jgi:hypothetical protein